MERKSTIHYNQEVTILERKAISMQVVLDRKRTVTDTAGSIGCIRSLQHVTLQLF